MMVTDLKRLGQVAMVMVMVMVMGLTGCGVRPDHLSSPSGDDQIFPAQYPAP